MTKNINKKNKIDFISVSAFLGAILIMPLVLFSGVLKPQVIENQAAGLKNTVAVEQQIVGDVNQDGVLNGRDVTLMLTELAKPDNRSLRFDLNGDGFIDSRDYTFMLEAMRVYGDE